MRVVALLVIVPIAAAADTGALDGPETVISVSAILRDNPPITYPG
jgi:hypothetical protein